MEAEVIEKDSFGNTLIFIIFMQLVINVGLQVH